MRAKLTLFALIASLSVSTGVSADYSTMDVGTTGNWYFGHWCPNATTYMYGMWGYVYQGRPWLMAGLCAGSASTAQAGNPNGYAGVPGPGTMQNSNCITPDHVAGLAGYYSSAGINSLWSRCYFNGSVYAAGSKLGSNTTGSYGSVRCSGDDHAIGITGSDRPRVLRIGLICR
jgi:hypothetical protein